MPDFSVIANCEHISASDRVLTRGLPISMFRSPLAAPPVLTGVILVMTGHFCRICATAAYSSTACTTPLVSLPSALSALYEYVTKQLPSLTEKPLFLMHITLQKPRFLIAN